MMKPFLIVAILATVTTWTLNIHGAAAFSQQVARNDDYPSELFREYYLQARDTLLDSLSALSTTQSARKAYLAAKGDTSKMSPEQIENFKGVSIRDLAANGMLPKIINHSLNLSGQNINDLTGLQDIPNIRNIKTLHLFDNLIPEIAPDSFAAFNDLSALTLNNNQLTTVPAALAALPKLKVIALGGNPLIIQPGAFVGLRDRLNHLNLKNTDFPDIERARIQTEVGADTNIDW